MRYSTSSPSRRWISLGAAAVSVLILRTAESPSAFRSITEHWADCFIDQPRSLAKVEQRGHRERHAEPPSKKPLSSCEDNGFRLVVGVDPGSSVDRCMANSHCVSTWTNAERYLLLSLATQR